MENEPVGNRWVAKKKGISMFRVLGLPPITLLYCVPCGIAHASACLIVDL
jgi:hypothetical protein